MALSSNEALEALITAANAYAAATAACDMAAIEAGKKASQAAHKQAMVMLEVAMIRVKAAADHVLLMAALYEAASKGKSQ